MAGAADGIVNRTQSRSVPDRRRNPLCQHCFPEAVSPPGIASAALQSSWSVIWPSLLIAVRRRTGKPMRFSVCPFQNGGLLRLDL